MLFILSTSSMRSSCSTRNSTLVSSAIVPGKEFQGKVVINEGCLAVASCDRLWWIFFSQRVDEAELIDMGFGNEVGPCTGVENAPKDVARAICFCHDKGHAERIKSGLER